MTRFLPPNLLALFFPRESLEFKPPIKNRLKPNNAYTGLAQYLENFDVNDEKVYSEPKQIETALERRERKKKEKKRQNKEILKKRMEKWNPADDPNAKGNPFKTLFICRLSYEASEDRLKKELQRYGDIRRVDIVYDSINGTPKGYAFVEFEHEKDMRAAYKRANGIKIKGRRIIVDTERGRTEKNWKPMYLGGGLGGDKRRDRRRRKRSDDSRDSSKRRDRDDDRKRDRDDDRRRDRDEDRKRDRDDERRRDRDDDRRRDRDDESRYSRDRKRDRHDESYQNFQSSINETFKDMDENYDRRTRYNHAELSRMDDQQRFYPR